MTGVNSGTRTAYLPEHLSSPPVLVEFVGAMDKSMTIPKEKSEFVNRRTDNTMAKRKKTNGQTMICKTLRRKLRIEHHEHI
jgi:hypothetical protein